jgi:hypothetical protein
MKASILTLVAAAALTCGSQVAQAHMLANDDAIVSVKSVSGKSSFAVMTAAGIRYHATANYKTLLPAKSNPGRAANAFQVARNAL